LLGVDKKMIISTIILFIALIINLIIFRKKNMLYPLCLKTVGIVLIVFSSVEYIVKLSTYSNLLDYEYTLYLLLSSIRLNFDTISTLANIGLTFITLGNILYFFIFSNYKKIWTIILCIPAFLVTYIGSTGFGNYIYLYCHTKNTLNSQDVNTAIITVQMLSLLLYMLLPYIVSVSNISKTKLFKNKKNILFKCIVWSTVDILTLLLIFVSDLKYYCFQNLSLIKYPLNTGVSVQNDFFIILSTVILLIFLIVGTIRYTPFKNLNPNFDNELFDYTGENFIMLLHTYKNAFCTITQFADCSNDFIQNDKYRFEVIKNIANDQFEEINRVINISRGTMDPNTFIEFVNITECIDNALSKTIDKSQITIKRDYYANNYHVLGDKSHLIEVFICIIKNSLEAMQQTDITSPTICITIGTERDKLYINITDNGIGIKNYYISKIFTPLFSSKSGGKNYGIGLTYAKRIIESHGGSISIKSKYSKYTTVQITLPNLIIK